MRRGWIAIRSIRRRQIPFVDTDVKAGLLELLFNIPLALLHERQKVTSQPGNFGEGETVFCDVDGLAGQVRRRYVALSRRGVAVDAHQMLLKFDGADSRINLKGSGE